MRATIEDGESAVPVIAAIRGENWEMDENICFMKTEQVAAHVGLSPRTLESYRTRGMGPVFYVLGSRMVRYLLSDVVKWASTRRRHSTSDDGLCRPAPEDEDEDTNGDEEHDGDGDGTEGPGRSRR